LLAAAVENPAAAQGLALAYAALDRAQRRMLIDAVIADTRATEISAAPVLLPLLAVEEDVELARYLASAMSASGGAGLRCDESCRALLAGDSSQGAALLARPLYGRFVEVLGLCWCRDQGVTHTVFEPLATRDDVQRHAKALPGNPELEDSPATYAVDVIAAALWQHRRIHGELPDLVSRFAELFEPSLQRNDPEQT
jgi:hypothetical protein